MRYLFPPRQSTGIRLRGWSLCGIVLFEEDADVLNYDDDFAAAFFDQGYTELEMFDGGQASLRR